MGGEMIRAAVAADVPALVALGQRFLAESSYAGILPNNPSQMAATARSLIELVNGAVFVNGDEELSGAIGLLKFVHHFSGKLTVGECFFFVDPAARGSLGVRLLTAAKQWAIEQGATTLQLVAPEGATRVEAFYQALHCTPLERAYVLVLS
jgi:GNAT superfamily N-acetyltransferase